MATWSVVNLGRLVIDYLKSFSLWKGVCDVMQTIDSYIFRRVLRALVFKGRCLSGGFD